MGEVFSSFSKWFSEKTSSPLYFTYLGFLVFWNWKFFQVIFLESANLFVTPRVEYVETALLFSVPVSQSVPFWVSSLIDWLANFAWHLIPPIILTYLAIVYLPKLNAWAFDIHLKNYFARKNAWRNASLEYIKGETLRLNEEVVEKKQQQVQRKVIEKIQTEEEKWEAEFLDNEKVLDDSGFSAILNAMYDKQGYIFGNGGHMMVSKTALAFVDSLGLITFTNTSRTQIALTEKGKFFAKKFLRNHRLY